ERVIDSLELNLPAAHHATTLSRRLAVVAREHQLPAPFFYRSGKGSGPGPPSAGPDRRPLPPLSLWRLPFFQDPDPPPPAPGGAPPLLPALPDQQIDRMLDRQRPCIELDALDVLIHLADDGTQRVLLFVFHDHAFELHRLNDFAKHLDLAHLQRQAAGRQV